MAKAPVPPPLRQLVKQASRDRARSIGISERQANQELAMALLLRHLAMKQPDCWAVGGSYALRSYSPSAGRLPGDLDLYCLTRKTALNAAEVFQAVVSDP